MAVNRRYHEAHHGGPAWQGSLTSQSKGGHAGGYKSTPQGTHQSGYDEHGRKGMKAGGTKKTASGKVPVRARVPTGQS